MKSKRNNLWRLVGALAAASHVGICATGSHAEPLPSNQRSGSTVLATSVHPQSLTIAPSQAPSRGGLGGSTGAYETFPWRVLLEVSTGTGGSECGAVLISPQWLITPAHCVFPIGQTPISITARIGASTDVAFTPELRSIVELHTYDSTSTNPRNDIALLKLNQPSTLPVASLASTLPQEGTALSVNSWGPEPEVAGMTANAIRSTPAVVTSAQTCQNHLQQTGLTGNANQICAAGTEFFSCLSQDGGPLYSQRSGHSLLVGLASEGITGCPLATATAAYTKLAPYRSWLEQNIEDSVPPSINLLQPAPTKGTIGRTGTIVSSYFTVEADVIDNLGVEQVNVSMDGTPLFSMTSAPYRGSIDSLRYANGVHVLEIEAIDSHGNASKYRREITVENLAPVITRQPMSQTVNENASVTMSFGVTGSNLTTQWYIFRPEGGGWAKIAGANSSAYTFIADASVADARYLAVVANRLGSVITAGDAQLTVRIPVQITTQPLSQAVGNGARVLLSVATRGTAPAYRWQFKSNRSGAAWTNIAAAVRSSYSFSASGSTVGTYRVIVSGAAGNSQTSTEAAIRIIAAPRITTAPTSITVSANTAAVFNVVASGEQLTYQWQSHPVIGGAWSNLVGQTTASLRVTANVATAIRYRVIVRNASGQSISSDARLRLR